MLMYAETNFVNFKQFAPGTYILLTCFHHQSPYRCVFIMVLGFTSVKATDCWINRTPRWDEKYMMQKYHWRWRKMILRSSVVSFVDSTQNYQKLQQTHITNSECHLAWNSKFLITESKIQKVFPDLYWTADPFKKRITLDITAFANLYFRNCIR